MTDEDLSWLVPQVIGHASRRATRSYSERARLAQTMQRDGKTLGRRQLAQPRARRRADDLHHVPLVLDHELLRLPSVADGQPEARRCCTTRCTSHAQLDARTTSRCCATTSTCWARTAASIGGRISPVRSSSAVVVSSQDLEPADRSTTSSRRCRPKATPDRRSTRTCPHTVRTTETKTCTDCHVSAGGDNNAVMSQLLLLGTNFVNFMGRFVFVAHRRRRRRSGGRDRDGGAAGGDRQRPAQARVSRSSTPRTRTRRSADDRRSIMRSTNALGVQVRGEYRLHRRRRGGFKVVRHRADQPEGLLREDRDARRCRRSARTRT